MSSVLIIQFQTRLLDLLILKRFSALNGFWETKNVMLIGSGLCLALGGVKVLKDMHESTEHSLFQIPRNS